MHELSSLLLFLALDMALDIRSCLGYVPTWGSPVPPWAAGDTRGNKEVAAFPMRFAAGVTPLDTIPARYSYSPKASGQCVSETASWTASQSSPVPGAVFGGQSPYLQEM